MGMPPGGAGQGDPTGGLALNPPGGGGPLFMDTPPYYNK